jgi:hypothetical protein
VLNFVFVVFGKELGLQPVDSTCCTIITEDFGRIRFVILEIDFSCYVFFHYGIIILVEASTQQVSNISRTCKATASSFPPHSGIGSPSAKSAFNCQFEFGF